jgi:hypothetical protein
MPIRFQAGVPGLKLQALRPSADAMLPRKHVHQSRGE